MDIQRMKVAGSVLYSRSVNPLKRTKLASGYIVGFDTEYTSKTNELVSVQLWHKDRRVFIPWLRHKKLTPAFLYVEAIKLVGHVDQDIILLTYFSLAELQFLPVVTEGIQIREYAKGSLDVAFPVIGAPTVLRIFDLCRWFDGRSLAKAARAMGLRKGSFDTTHVTRACLRDPNFEKYALHDAYLCYEIGRRLRAEFLEGCGVDILVVKTPASAAANTFRGRYIDKKLFCDINRARYAACRGTWGGRAEAFFRGTPEGEHVEYDFTSAYPMSAIKLGEMPIQGSWREYKTLRGVMGARGGFAEITFCYPIDTEYPGLPVYTKDAMIYPLAGRSWCTFEEIKQAVRDGAEIHIVEAWGYRRGTTALRDFLQWTLDARADAVGAGKVMYKLLGNSIIGKFAQQISRVPIDELYRIAEEENFLLEDMFELNTPELIALGCAYRVSVGSIFMPEWNGLICGYTRAALAELVKTGEAVYCHTDSAWCAKLPKCSRLPFGVKTRGPATVIRTRFAGMGRPMTPRGVRMKKSHVAHHSIWSLETACEMIRSFEDESTSLVGDVTTYSKSRPLKLRESVKSGRTLGKWVKESRRGSTSWCGKRQLLKGGITIPWGTAEQYLDNRRAMRKMERARDRA